MASSSRNPDGDGVRFVHEDDGRVTAVDEETGVASFGDTKAEALRMLAEALELHEGGGQPVTENDIDEFDIDTDDVDETSNDVPEFLE